MMRLGARVSLTSGLFEKHQVEREWTRRVRVPAPAEAAFLQYAPQEGDQVVYVAEGHAETAAEIGSDAFPYLVEGRAGERKAPPWRDEAGPLWEFVRCGRGVFACTVRAARYELPPRTERCRSVVAVLDLALVGVPRDATDAYCGEFLPPGDVAAASVVTRRRVKSAPLFQHTHLRAPILSLEKERATRARALSLLSFKEKKNPAFPLSCVKTDPENNLPCRSVVDVRAGVVKRRWRTP